jgi:hypothetical protein
MKNNGDSKLPSDGSPRPGMGYRALVGHGFLTWRDVR